MTTGFTTNCFSSIIAVVALLNTLATLPGLNGALSQIVQLSVPGAWLCYVTESHNGA